MNERDRSLQLLRRIDREGLFASVLLQNESGFVRTSVLGVLRWRSRLDAIIATLAERRVEKLDRAVVEILRLGIHEVMFMETAKFAVVSEIVELAKRHASRARGFVNAIMRRATERDLHTIGASPAIRTAHPEWLFRRWERQFGSERTLSMANANQAFSYPDVLSLDGSIPPEAVPSNLVDRIFRLRGSSANLDRAHFYPMDEGSAVIAAITRATGTDVADLAAAPGGKSMYMSTTGARVVSADLSLSRLQPLVRSGHARVVVADGRQPPFRRRFESVLLDAPCSATGTLRKNPEIKWRLKEEDIAGFATLQRELLIAAMEVASHYVVYSTCSLELEENDDVVRIADRHGFAIADVGPYTPPGAKAWVADGVLRLTPESGADGFTAFVLQRSR